MDDKVENFLRNHEICYDRFTFDKIFRFLLENNFDHEDAKDIILFNCSLSAITLQERIHNRFYLSIEDNEEISADLLKFRNDIAKVIIEKSIVDLLY